MNLIENNLVIHMYINNEEVVCNKNINIVEQMTNPNTIILNNCYPLSWEEDKDYKSRYYMPRDYSLFKLTADYNEADLITENNKAIYTEDGRKLIISGDGEIVLFAGIIKRSSEMNLRPDNPHFATLQVLDFKTFLSEGELFNFVIADMTIADAIEYAISQYEGYNFTLGNLNIGQKVNEIINNYNCNQKTLYDVLEYFAKITNSVWTAQYIADDNIEINFYDINNLPHKEDLIYSQNYFEENSIVDITYSLNSTNYRNKQIMTSDKIKASTITNQEYITLGQTYKTYENISSIVSAKINGVNITIATTGDKENGETADLYYRVGTNEFTINEQILPGQNLEIQYYPEMSGRQVILNQEEINRIDNLLNNTGVIARYENRKDATNSDELNAIGQSYIQFKSKAEITLKVKTLNNDMYNVGDLIFFNTNNTIGLENLIDTYAVKKKTREIIQNNSGHTNNIFYIYELSNNYNFESEINYFDNQRAKIIGNIKEGEYINRYVENYKNYNIIFNPPVINGGV